MRRKPDDHGVYHILAGCTRRVDHTMAGVAEDTLSSEQDTSPPMGGDSAVGEAVYGRRRRMRREEVVAAQLHKWYPVSPNTPQTISPTIPTPQSPPEYDHTRMSLSFYSPGI
jgi:hypothetical protein